MKSTVLAIVVCLTLHALTSQAQSIDGVVREKGTDKPVEGARVALYTGSMPTFQFGGSSPTAGEAITDAEGRFTITTKPGRYRIAPARDGMVFAHPLVLQFPREPGTWVEVTDQQTVKDLQLHMQREAAISGRVVDSKGSVFPGTSGSAALRVYRYDEYGARYLAGLPGISYPGSAWSFVRPNDRGEFRLYGLPPGEYYLTVSGGGSSTFFPGNADEEHAPSIHLAAGEDLRLGTITMPPPPVNTKVTLRFMRDGAPFVMSNPEISVSRGLMAAAGQRSEFQFALPPGNHALVVSTRSFGPEAEGFYGRTTIVVGSTDVTQDIEIRPGAKLKSKFSMDGVAMQSPLQCRMVGTDPFSLAACNNTTVAPGHYRFGLQTPLTDAYIKSVKVGDRDILADGIQITGDTELDIQLGSHGADINGTVTDSTGDKAAHAIVALVPDAPLRAATPLYRSATADLNGSFQLHGIAPGVYRLFAWTELPGFAYLNAEFMKKYDDGGKPVVIEKTEPIRVDVRLTDEAK